MKSCVIILVLIFFVGNHLYAQRVLYSPFIGSPADTKFEVIGRSGNYYWVQKTSINSRSSKKTKKKINQVELSFEIYDGRMNLVKTMAASIADTILKEYFVSGAQYMDQLILTHLKKSTGVLLNRYTDDGVADTTASLLCTFPGNMGAEDFLLMRSEDKNKILLLGFETVPDSAPTVHSFLFDRNWKLLNHVLIKDRRITQPFGQYDLINYPLEHFTNCPVKLANSGEWFMLSSVRVNQGSLLFHFAASEKQVEIKEIFLSKNSTIQDVCLSLNNKKRELLAGILLQYRPLITKGVSMLHYSLDTCKVLYDSSYKFNTLAVSKNSKKTVCEEYFMAVPGKGFLLLKEYGRVYDNFSADELNMQNDDGPLSFTKTGYEFGFNKNDYTRYNQLAGTRALYDRGDLSMYYFPATNKDSCWSGIINKEQVTELNKGNLSYVFLPLEDKLFFLYNSFYRNDGYSSSTILDVNGNALNEGLVYWNIRNTLLFQKARQISEKEIAVPYEKNSLHGFAVIKLAPIP